MANVTPLTPTVPEVTARLVTSTLRLGHAATSSAIRGAAGRTCSKLSSTSSRSRSPICPASEEHLIRGLRASELDFRAGGRARVALAAWLAEHDLREAVELVGAKPLFISHARGDERIPYTWSEELYARAREPRKLVVVAGGHHRSIQHDAELQGESLRWIERRLR